MHIRALIGPVWEIYRSGFPVYISPQLRTGYLSVLTFL